MTERGLLFVFSGPSGVGKDTVLKKFLQVNSDCALSVSATTREPREGEVDGKDYFFITKEKFGELVSKGEMLEYAEYSGNYYGTPKAMVEEQLNAGKNVILEIEAKGAVKIREMKLGSFSIFLMPPSWQTLRDRLTGRGTNSPESIAERLSIAKTEIESAHLYNYVVINDDLDECVADMKLVISAAKHCADYHKNFIEEVLKDAETIDVPNN